MNQFCTNSIFTDFETNLTNFLLNELDIQTEDYKVKLYDLNKHSFKFKFEDIKFEKINMHKSVWKITFTEHSLIIYGDKSHDYLKLLPSHLLINKINNNTDYIKFLEKEFNKYYSKFLNEYIEFTKKNLKTLLDYILYEKIKFNYKDESFANLFKHPNLIVFAYVDHKEKISRYKPGEGYAYNHTFTYKYKINCYNPTILDNSKFLQIREELEQFEKVEHEYDNDLCFTSGYRGKKFFNGEVNYDISHLVNHYFTNNLWWQDLSFLNQVSKYPTDFTNSTFYFLSLIYLYLYQSDIDEIIDLNGMKFLNPQFEIFSILFNIYQLLFSQIVDRYENSNRIKFSHRDYFFKNLNILDLLSFKKRRIIDKVKINLNIDNIDILIENYYLNRQTRFDIDKLHDNYLVDIKYLYRYFFSNKFENI